MKANTLPKSGKSIIQTLIERDGLECHWCKRTCKYRADRLNPLSPTVEHLIRKADGGTSHLSNLVVACKRCNNERHADGWQPSLSVTRGIKIVKGVRMEKHFGKWFKVVGEFPPKPTTKGQSE